MNVSKLTRLHACNDAVEWAKTQPDMATAWAKCERGDWMLWLLGRTICCEPGVTSRGPLVKAACACARLSLKYVPKGEKRPLAAIRAAEARLESDWDTLTEGGEAGKRFCSECMALEASGCEMWCPNYALRAELSKISQEVKP